MYLLKEGGNPRSQNRKISVVSMTYNILKEVKRKFQKR